MKILKLLPVMFSLNYITPCEAVESILFYVASQPSFFKLSLSDLRYDIKEKIDIPLAKDEIKDFNSEDSFEEGEDLRTSHNCSLRNLIKEYADLDRRNPLPRKWFLLLDYIPVRVSFLFKFFLKKFLTNEVEIENLLQRDDYNDQKIREIFFLMNYLAESFNEIIPGVYHNHTDNSIESYRNVINYNLLSLLESKRH